MPTKKQKTPPKLHDITVVAGVEGPSVYLNDYRIAGPKPWGGGKILYQFFADDEDLAAGAAQPQTDLATTRQQRAIERATPITIAVRRGLHAVVYKQIGGAVTRLRKLKPRVGTEMTQLHLAPIWRRTPTFYDSQGKMCGIAVAVAKTDTNFVEHVDGIWRYRVRAVLTALREAVTAHKHTCSGRLRYGQRDGAIVFDLYGQGGP